MLTCACVRVHSASVDGIVIRLSRYEGGGIRWDINLVKYNATHIARHGAYVVPQVDSPQPTEGISALVEVITEGGQAAHHTTPTNGIAGTAAAAAAAAAANNNNNTNNNNVNVDVDSAVTALFTLFAPPTTSGAPPAVVASCTADSISSSGRATRRSGVMLCKLKPTRPLLLWSVRAPTMYTVQCDLLRGTTTIDSVTWTTGFRNAVRNTIPLITVFESRSLIGSAAPLASHD